MPTDDDEAIKTLTLPLDDALDGSLDTLVDAVILLSVPTSNFVGREDTSDAGLWIDEESDGLW